MLRVPGCVAAAVVPRSMKFTMSMPAARAGAGAAYPPKTVQSHALSFIPSEHIFTLVLRHTHTHSLQLLDIRWNSYVYG